MWSGALFVAAEEGDVECARGLIQNGADVNAQTTDGWRALMRAAENGRVDVVRFLAEQGADVHSKTKAGETALMGAADNGHADVVHFLIQRGVDVNVKTKGGWTALLCAADNGHTDVVRILTECGAYVNPATTYGRTALMRAAENGHMECVRYLTEHGAKSSAKSIGGWTALMCAADNGHMDVVHFLFNCCANVNATTTDGWTALMCAAESGHVDVVRFLTENGAHVNAVHRDGQTVLIKAADNQHKDVVRFLAERGADINAKSDDGWTSLMRAVDNGHLDFVRFLIECGADINAKEKDGCTALLWAARNNLMEQVRFLADCGADVDCKTTDGWTAVMWAAQNGHTELVCFLTESGAHVNATNGVGETALVHAADKGHMDIVRFLLDHGADVNAKRKDGWTVLMWAAGKGFVDFARFLTEHGAKVNDKNWGGTTALMLAAENGHTDVVRFLAEHGADVNTVRMNGWTALMCAANLGNIDIVRYLTERGANVNATTTDGTTILIHAAGRNHAKVVRYLVANGASSSARNRDGDTAIRIAERNGHQEIVRVLAPLEETSQRQLSQRISSMDSLRSRYLSRETIPPLEIELQQLIDVGNLGGDYRAKWLDTDVVVKLFVSDASTASFADEVHLWQRLRHPNIIKLYGACEDGILQLFVCEYASNGSLDEYLKSCDPERRMPWKYLHQAALGLEFLHERKIVHGDLRCRNILVGSDGLVKLANFELSMSASAVKATTMLKDSMRWQSPERLVGEEASFASDVYSLGMCIVEAVTGNAPWGNIEDYSVDFSKRRWRPEVIREGEKDEPSGLDNESLILVRRMCCHDPVKRMNIAAVVFELDVLAAKGEMIASESSVHCLMPSTPTIEAYNLEEVGKLWLSIQTFFNEHDNLSHLHQQVVDLRELHLRLQIGEHHQLLLSRFQSLLIDFHTTLKTLASAEQARIMQLSATRTTTHSIHAFHRRITTIWRMLDNSTNAAHEREERWAEQRSHQIEFFVSEVSKTWLLLNELETAEERSTFLAFLKYEMEISVSNYSEGQLAIIKKAYNEVASHVGPEALVMRTPEWFIPWYELQLDQSCGCLGKGGYGSVHRAKWLDSEVVVKQVGTGTSESLGPSWMSRSHTTVNTPSTPNPSAKAKKAEMREMFKREAAIWFGLSHPHVVRLFGACHVGSPFFVCEYATNGTLVEYLRKYPGDLWRLLHEAALGVQYLHEREIVHGDLKGNNIVIGSDKKAKVTDFGLSSTMSALGDSTVQISAAWHWVAPECLTVEGTRPTFASDVFSLGMCIIEALRVVGSLKHEPDSHAPPPLPWEDFQNAVVKVHLSRGNLPTQPIGCSDDSWTLIKRMCCHDPAKRLKISTVVDELADLRSSRVEGSLSEVKNTPDNAVLESKQLPDVLAAMKTLLKKLCGSGLTRFSRKLKKNLFGQVDGRVEIWHLYLSLWKRIEFLHSHIVTSQQIGHQDEKICLLAEGARASTLELPGLGHTLREMTEAEMRGYELHRRLDKLISANSLCTTETKWSSYPNWTKAGDMSLL